MTLTPEDFDFELPERLIALRPARPRPAARLLVAQGDSRSDSTVADLPHWLRRGDLLVFNDTRVLSAFLVGTRTRQAEGGAVAAQVSINLMARLGPGRWQALARPARKLAPSDRVDFGPGLTGTVTARDGAEVEIDFDLVGDALDAAIEQGGQMPLPPYIAQRRPADAADRDDYQTAFATRPGAVAAPTASLHFDAPLLAALAAAGINSTRLTLHVGAGTFLPVKANRIEDHRMHAEWGEIGPEAAQAIADTLAAGHRVIPVGTTALRLIETAATGPGRIGPWGGETDIFIRPGHRFAVTSGLMTNFHLPRSTLMMLVAALMGLDRIRAIYAHAIAQDYRFFSYGDSSLLLPDAA